VTAVRHLKKDATWRAVTIAAADQRGSAGQDERWQDTGPVIRRVLNLPAGNPAPGEGTSKSAAQRRRHRAA
jgi:hypothetical protein